MCSKTAESISASTPEGLWGLGLRSCKNTPVAPINLSLLIWIHHRPPPLTTHILFNLFRSFCFSSFLRLTSSILLFLPAVSPSWHLFHISVFTQSVCLCALIGLSIMHDVTQLLLWWRKIDCFGGVFLPFPSAPWWQARSTQSQELHLRRQNELAVAW